ncbi:hypothetical protein JOD01_000185 [Brevibacillus fulvus]|uniref:Uncharacterized protein n=1 Tax=Brevibacillus fulvus TaxID=1125967 RepID=A0A938XX56_9BACL|nr:hypothetical protein [Brevibacillus fulvus]
MGDSDSCNRQAIGLAQLGMNIDEAEKWRQG